MEKLIKMHYFYKIFPRPKIIKHLLLMIPVLNRLFLRVPTPSVHHNLKQINQPNEKKRLVCFA